MMVCDTTLSSSFIPDTIRKTNASRPKQIAKLKSTPTQKATQRSHLPLRQGTGRRTSHLLKPRV